jgi:hypothetical protein
MKFPIFVVSLSLSSSLSILPLSTITLAEASSPPVLISKVHTSVQAEAQRWTVRLTAHQEQYYKKHGVFAKTIEQVFTAIDPASGLTRQGLKEIEASYTFVIKEKPGAIYTKAIPRDSEATGYSTAMSFKYGPNRTLTILGQGTCSGKQGQPPEEVIVKEDGKITCAQAADPFEQRSQSSQSSPTENRSQQGSNENGLVNEVKNRVPSVFKNIFK